MKSSATPRCCILLFIFTFPQSFINSWITVGAQSTSGDPELVLQVELSVILSLRKCCDLDHVFVTSRTRNHGCGKLPSNYNHDTFLNITKQLFFPKIPSRVVANVSTGFENLSCPYSSLIRLEPQKYAADEFYPTADGRLATPRRFVSYDNVSHCMEDFVEDGNYHELKRGTFVCIEDSVPFPVSAVDEHGKFQPLNIVKQDFLTVPEASDPLNLTGRLVVRKCCDPNSVYLADEGRCELLNGLKTPEMEKLLKNNTLFVRSGFPSCSDSSFFSSDEFNATFRFTATGKLRLVEPNFEIELNQQNYCLDDFLYYTEDGPIVLVQAQYCYTEDASFIPITESTEFAHGSEEVVVLPKCCKDGYFWTNNACTRYYDDKTFPKFVQSQLSSAIQDIHTTSSLVTLNNSIFRGNLSFDRQLKLPVDNRTQQLFYLNDTLRVVTHLGTRGPCVLSVTYKLSSENFCIDTARTDFSSNDFVGFHPVIMHQSTAEPQNHVPLFIPSLLIISAVAMVATFVVYLIAPAQIAVSRIVSKTGRNQNTATSLRSQIRLAETLFGRTLLCHIFSLTGAFIALSVAQFDTAVPGTSGCAALGLMVYFFFMGSFAWLTIICFDLWWQFRSVVRAPDDLRFIPYSIIGWGVPVVSTSIALAADFQDDFVSCSRRPHFGIVRCWFYGDDGMLAFFYAPISAMLALNGLFFILLVLNLRLLKNCRMKQAKSTNVGLDRKAGHDQRIPTRKNNLWLGFKLLLIMGIPWLLEVLSWLPSVRHRNTWQYFFLQTASVINSLRGVVLFVIFVLLRPKILRFLRNKLKPSPHAPDLRVSSFAPSLQNREKADSLPADETSQRNHNARSRQLSGISTITVLTRTNSTGSLPCLNEGDFTKDAEENFTETTYL